MDAADALLIVAFVCFVLGYFVRWCQETIQSDGADDETEGDPCVKSERCLSC
jgi:hypothetical protein